MRIFSILDFFLVWNGFHRAANANVKRFPHTQSFCRRIREDKYAQHERTADAARVHTPNSNPIRYEYNECRLPFLHLIIQFGCNAIVQYTHTEQRRSQPVWCKFNHIKLHIVWNRITGKFKFIKTFPCSIYAPKWSLIKWNIVKRAENIWIQRLQGNEAVGMCGYFDGKQLHPRIRFQTILFNFSKLQHVTSSTSIAGESNWKSRQIPSVGTAESVKSIYFQMIVCSI